MAYSSNGKPTRSVPVDRSETVPLTLPAAVAGNITQAYRFCNNASDLVCCYLKLALDSTNSTQGEVHLKETKLSVGAGLIVAGEKEQQCFRSHPDEDCPRCLAFYAGHECEPVIDNDLERGVRCVGIKLRRGSSMVIPLRYQNKTIGLMSLASTSTGHYSQAHAEAGQVIANRIAQHLKRYEANDFIKQKFGKDLMLVGASEALRRADEFIEKASRVDLPVLIKGEFGVEKEHLAYAIHLTSPRREGPFTKVNCAALYVEPSQDELSELFKQSDQGTIFFEGIDELDYKLQLQLLKILGSRVGEWANSVKRTKSVDARVVASVGTGLYEMVKKKTFSHHLLAALNFLSISVAPLRERKEDIKPLIEYFLWKYSVEPTLDMTKEVMELCEGYSWPANVAQIERVIARLATMSEKRITVNDFRLNTLELAEALPMPEGQMVFTTGRSWVQAAAVENEVTDQAGNIAALANYLMEHDSLELKDLHYSLQRALIYLAQNCSKEIKLNQLAQHARVSSSHLCYLFRKELNVNFKSVLSALRIEKAKRLLIDRPSLTTSDVSSEVGYSDPRHYQRLFKHLVGCTSREYKLKQLNKRG